MSLPAYAMNVATFPELYEQWLVAPLFRPWGEIVLDRTRLAAGDRVLDVACGTGVMARLAKERLGEGAPIVGVDASPQMLAVARTAAPGIDWRQGSASALPLLEGERFDVVLCQQGLQFFPDKPAAVAEMKRAMRQGGRLVAAVWRPLAEMPFCLETYRVAERRLGAFVDQRHSFGDTVSLERLIVGAGFDDVHVEAVTHTVRFPEPGVLVRMNATALVGMSAASSTMNDEARTRVVDLIVDESADVVRAYCDADGLAFELGANIVTARA